MGHRQFCTEMEAKVTAKQAWSVETRRLQNSKDLFGRSFLKEMKANVHAITPKTTTFITSRSRPEVTAMAAELEERSEM